jgi:hypothetical protein
MHRLDALDPRFLELTVDLPNETIEPGLVTRFGARHQDVLRV